MTTSVDEDSRTDEASTVCIQKQSHVRVLQADEPVDAPPSKAAEERDWHEIDRSGQPNDFVSYLDTVRTLEPMRVYKARSIEWLRLGDGLVALDAGCGTGDDARILAQRIGPGGQVWGIDASSAMIEESIRRSAGGPQSVHFKVAPVEATGFPDATFDAIRSDRLFQHVPDPAAALQELVRVLKPGGRIAVSDTDWGSLIIDAPESAAMTAYLSFTESWVKHPRSGRRLYALFRAAGLREVEVAADSLLLPDYSTFERITGIEFLLPAAIEAGALSSQDAESLRTDFRARHKRGCFFASVTIFTVCGRKP